MPFNNIPIEILDLTKIFKDFWGREKVRAVDKLSLRIFQGEVFGLLGPNGSGKTTTIKIILGLLFPSSGKISVYGCSPRHVKNKHRIGFLPEESYLYPYQNAEEALDFYGSLFKISTKTRKNRVQELLEMVGLTRARKRPLKEYSKGMARRIGVAQALINNPDLVILDEPTTGLDPIGTREMKDIIMDLKKYGKTVLLCSHLLADVEDVCDRIAILYGGKCLALGGVKDLLSHKDMIQITIPEIGKDSIQKLTAVLNKEAGVTNLEISHPKERLEQYFLEVIENAQRQALTTSGAEKGKRIEGLFQETPPEVPLTSEALINALMEKKEKDREKPQENIEPKPVPKPEPDQAVIEKLLSSNKPEPIDNKEDIKQQEIIEAGKRKDDSSDILKKLIIPNNENQKTKEDQK